MKLILDGEKLDMYLDKICWTPEDRAAVFRYCKLDPADLDLAALGAWGNLRAWLKTGIEYFGSLEKTAMNQERIHRYKMVLEKIAYLESAADLKVPEVPFACAQDVLVQAKAWVELRKKYQSLTIGNILSGADRQRYAVIKGAVLDDMNKALNKAHAELALPASLEQEKGEEKRE